MQRLLAFVLVAILAVRPAIAQPKDKPKEAASASPTLAEPGQEPRRELRYDLKKGAKFDIDVELTTESLDRAMDGTVILEDTRGSRFTLRTEVDNVLKDGSHHLVFRVDGFRQVDKEGKPVEDKGLTGLFVAMV